MLNNEWYKTALIIWKVKNSILGVSEEPFDQNRELARSSELQVASEYILFVRSTNPRARSVERPSEFFC